MKTHVLFFALYFFLCKQVDSCDDKSWKCMILKDECNSKSNSNFMKENCQKTCGLCKGCKDESPRCARFKTYCKKSQYKTFLKKICKHTCGFCEDNYIASINEFSHSKPKLPTESCGRPDVQSGRVINGRDAKRGVWPWQVLLTYFGNAICGGSIISPQWIVTAAHCIGRNTVLTDYFKVIVGEHDLSDKAQGVTHDIDEIKIHEGYVASNFDKDIALIRLKVPIQFNKYVKPVCLPASDDAAKVGTNCFITGWGKVDPKLGFHHYLQQAEIPVISNEQCAEMNTNSTGIEITDSMLCAGHGAGVSTSGCQGDSGGPLVCKLNNRWILHGAVSWGSQYCDTKEAYTVFARISSLRQWIDEHLIS